ncbi:MAG: hypothetical protein NTX15_08380 [Candidatus Kapabacteria bacterium]|nr:hypothetical protein [Candidatus Kapabacteria bacterium]
MSLLTTKTARTMMYLLGIGGLLVCNGVIVAVIWNGLLHDSMGNEHHLTFLEGTGITAFAYVVVFAVKYGRAGVAFSPSRSFNATDGSSVAKRCAEMTADQRAALRQELVQSCGCRESEAK